MSPLGALAVAVSSAVLFVAMAAYRLDRPGLYYDEVHQVPAAYAWLGRPAAHFSMVSIAGGPWLTMTYSGAVKSALFALLLGVSGAEFSAALWRGLAIGLVAAGWVWCVAAVGWRWGPIAQAAFAALLLTDTTVLLTTRHDWGPTALALALRLCFLAVWLRHERLSASAAFTLGAITGLAIFEKLSSVVLLAPLALALASGQRHVALGVAGLAFGALPLFLVNVATWSHGAGMISLANLDDPGPVTPPPWSWPVFAGDYLSLGRGDSVRRWVLDLGLESRDLWLEGIVLAALLSLACARRETARLVAAWVAIAAALALLPRRTEAHHWILGTPFQYAAIAALAGAAGRLAVSARVLVVLLLVLRLPGVWETTSAIAANRTEPRFDPELTRVAQILAWREEAMVVASTWGIANQIVAFSGGRRDAVHEPIYDDLELERVERTLAESSAGAVYLVEVPRYRDLFSARRERVQAAIGAARWREVPVEDELEGLSVVRVRKFANRRPISLGPGSDRPATASAARRAAEADRWSLP